MLQYGHTVDRTDFDHDAWIKMGIEELLDSLMYFARASRWEVIPAIYHIILDIIRLEALDLYEKTREFDLTVTSKMDG